MTATLEDLAAKVIAMLNAQQRYFKTHGHGELIASKKIEAALRKECEQILGVQKGLFNGDSR